MTMKAGKLFAAVVVINFVTYGLRAGVIGFVLWAIFKTMQHFGVI